MDHLKGFIGYLKNYRVNGFTLALASTKKLAIEIDIESTFHEKRVIRRKSQFDENVNHEVKHSAEDSFRIKYFLYIVDQSFLP